MFEKPLITGIDRAVELTVNACSCPDCKETN